jgi:hypothetical protein
MLIIIALYLGLNVYLFMRSIMWLRSLKGIFKCKLFTIVYLILYIFMMTTLLWAFVLPQGTAIQRAIKYMSNYWLGAMLYALMFVVAADCIMLILRLFKLKLPIKHPFATVGALVAVLIFSTTTYGLFHARDIKHKEYTVTVDKSFNDMKIVLISDIHMGYSVGADRVEGIVDEINALNPDVVCIAGDLFDNLYEAIDDPARCAAAFSSIRSKYGVYGTWGNHDVTEALLGGFSVKDIPNNSRDPRFEQFCRDSNITMLEDEAVLINDSVYIVGRLDAFKPATEDDKRATVAKLTEQLDKTKPLIILEHEPSELSAQAGAGADLGLYGHTHDGQMFPGNLIIKLFWQNPYGLLKVDDMTTIVTSGVGVWGPDMRVMTDSEVVTVNLKSGIGDKDD